MFGSSNQSVAQGGFVVTPSDVSTFAVRARALYIGSDGNVTVTGANGAQVTFLGVPAGTILPIETLQVKASGTTASNIVGLI